MPVRRRFSKARDLGLHDFLTMKYGTDAALVNTFGSLENARKAYEAYRDDSRLVSMAPGDRPVVYWLFEGPQELRGDGGEGLTPDEKIRQTEELECQRLRWLRDNGLLREGEGGVLEERGCD